MNILVLSRYLSHVPGGCVWPSVRIFKSNFPRGPPEPPPPPPQTRLRQNKAGPGPGAAACKQCHECASNISNHSQISNGQMSGWTGIEYMRVNVACWPHTQNMKCILSNKVVIHRDF